MKLKGACIQTRNASALVGFYTKLFGFEPEVDGGVDFRFFDFQLVVFKLTDEHTEPTRNIALIYETDDVDRDYEKLAGLGIVAENPPTDKPWGVRSFVVADPDGNTISFIKQIDK